MSVAQPPGREAVTGSLKPSSAPAYTLLWAVIVNGCSGVHYYLYQGAETMSMTSWIFHRSDAPIFLWLNTARFPPNKRHSL